MLVYGRYTPDAVYQGRAHLLNVEAKIAPERLEVSIENRVAVEALGVDSYRHAVDCVEVNKLVHDGQNLHVGLLDKYEQDRSTS